MEYGVREICDVVLKAKATQKIGNKIFYKNEPVLYFTTLKSSSIEGAATTSYAQGGRGNARLMAWEGERTVTFTMEDALISPEGFMILSGAGLTEGSEASTIKQHVTETVDKSLIVADSDDASEATTYTIRVKEKPYLPSTEGADFAYVMFVKDGEIISEPFIPEHYATQDLIKSEQIDGVTYYDVVVKAHDNYNTATDTSDTYALANLLGKYDYDSVIVDYYTEKASGAMQIDITADKFGGNYYLEASTLFRNKDGVDVPAEFIIPNCKVQSNFTFSMASTGDPSSFTFTLDAFPDYTRFDHSKKVLAALQIVADDDTTDLYRTQTSHAASDEQYF